MNEYHYFFTIITYNEQKMVLIMYEYKIENIKLNL